MPPILPARPLGRVNLVQIDAAGTDREGIGPALHSAQGCIWLQIPATRSMQYYPGGVLPNRAAWFYHHHACQPDHGTPSYGAIPQVAASFE